MFEELLISGTEIKTENEKIFMANETFIDYKKLKPVLEKIQTNIANYNNEEILNILTENVEGFDRWKKNLFLL